MALPCTVSEINSDCSRKVQIFLYTAVYFTPPAEGVPHGIGYRHSGVENHTTMGLRDRERRLTISSGVWIQLHETTETDGWTPTVRLRGKKINPYRDDQQYR